MSNDTTQVHGVSISELRRVPFRFGNVSHDVIHSDIYMYVYMHIIRMCVHQAHYSLARRHPGMTSTRFLAIQPMNKCARHKNPDEANTLRPDSELLTHTTHGMPRGQVHAFRRRGKGSKLLELAKHQTSKSIRRQIDHRLYNLQHWQMKFCSCW